jgi:hypothetical protein
MSGYVIHPDKCAIRLFLFPQKEASAVLYSKSNKRLFEHLFDLHRQTLVMTPEMKEYAKRNLETAALRKDERRVCSDRLERIKSISIDKKINEYLFKRKLKETKDFFEEYINKNSIKSNCTDIRMVCSKYRDVVLDAAYKNAEKSLVMIPGREDEEMLAKVLSSMVEGRKNYFLSVDGHFSKINVSNAIDGRFGVRPGYPADILSAIMPR